MCSDVCDESVRIQLAALNLLEAALPLGGEQGRAQGVGQHGHERRAGTGRHELALMRSAKPPFTSFSIVAARVAGVPRPLSLGVSRSLFSARVFMAASSVTSVKAAGGVVLPSLTVAASMLREAPSESPGSGIHSGAPLYSRQPEVDDGLSLGLERMTAALGFN